MSTFKIQDGKFISPSPAVVIILTFSIFIGLLSCNSSSNKKSADIDKHEKELLDKIVAAQAYADTSVDSAIVRLKSLKQQVYELNSPWLTARLHIKTGNVYLKKNLLRLALAEYEPAIEAAKKIEDQRESELKVLNNIGQCNMLLAEYEKAIEAFSTIARISLEKDDKESYYRTISSLSRLNAKLSLLDLAEKQALEVIAYSKTVENKSQLAAGMVYLANVVEKRNDIPRAIQIYHDAMVIFEEIQETNFLVSTYQTLALLHAKLHNEDEAMKYYYLGRSLEADNKPAEYQIMNDIIYGDMMTELGKKANAWQAYKSAYELSLASKSATLTQALNKFFANSVALEKLDAIRDLYPVWDSLMIAENIQKANERAEELSMLLDTKLNDIKLENEKTLRHKREQLLITISIAFVMLIAVSAWSLLSYLKIKKQNKLLFEKSIQLIKEQEYYLVADANRQSNSIEPNLTLTEKFRKKLLEEKWFADPELSLTSAASKLGTNPRYLSFAINQTTSMNFNAFVNQERIRLAQQKMLEMADGSMNLEEFAESTGFANRQTFFRAFKQVTGLSPTQYKEFVKSKSSELAQPVETPEFIDNPDAF